MDFLIDYGVNKLLSYQLAVTGRLVLRVVPKPYFMDRTLPQTIEDSFYPNKFKIYLINMK